MGDIQSKVKVRKELNALLDQKMPWTDSQANEKLTRNLLSVLGTASGTWLGYKAMFREADPQKAIEALGHLRWVWPKMQGQELRLFESSQFVQGPYGIWEPDTTGAIEVKASELDGVLVPGLGFDVFKSRLGRGRGFYDRLLKGIVGVKIGVGFDCQILKEKIPTEQHDCRMDILVSEERIWK